MPRKPRCRMVAAHRRGSPQSSRPEGKRGEEDFAWEMARMARDPEIRSACALIERDFRPFEGDGL